LKRAGTEPHARSTVRPRRGSDHVSKCRERHFETRDRHGEPPGGREPRNCQRKVRGATLQPRPPPRGPPEKEATTFQNAASGILKRAGTEPHARSTVPLRRGSDHISKCRERNFETCNRHGEPPEGREPRNCQRKVRGATQQPRPPPRGPPEKEATTFQNAASGILKCAGTEPHARSTVRPRRGSDHISKCRERHFETRDRHGEPPGGREP